MKIIVVLVVMVAIAAAHSVVLEATAPVVVVLVAVVVVVRIHFGRAPAGRHAMQLNPVPNHLNLLFGAQRVARLEDQAHEAEKSRHIDCHGFAEVD